MSVSDAPEVRNWVASLPQFEPADTRWPRILAQRAARQRRRRSLLALAAASLLVAILGWRGLSAPGHAGPEWAGAQRRALELEADVLNVRRAQPAAAARSWREEASLARLDRELQAAYEQGADPRELARLWRTRGDLENALLATYQRPGDLVRL
jgi:hypothetical protein